jgi:hypothetical protein
MAVAELTCARCGAQFVSPVKRGPKPKFCGESCKALDRTQKPPSRCSIDGCVTRATTAGLCTKHYQRKRAHGDPAAPAMVTKPCEYCGEKFTGRRNRRWCGWKCRSRSMGAKPAEEIIANAKCRKTYHCEHCAVEFRPKRVANNRFCSRDCAFAHKAERKTKVKAPLPPKPCIDCSLPIRRGQRCTKCSRARTLKAGREAYYASRGDVVCRDCAAPIANDGSYQRRCPSCWADRDQALRRAARQVRKHRQRVATVERFDPLEVLERDGWRCHMCGKRTPKERRGTFHDNAPELDHIIPLAKGGSHSRANTACSCRRCNLRKSDKVLGQPSLFSAA